jgi:transcriptional regulator with XRE-family HTH domain
VILLRQEIGDVLRDARRQQGRTLREVSSVARVSLGYLSEVERGQKEASSELLASICGALEVPLSSVLREVSQRVAATEQPAARNGQTAQDGTMVDGAILVKGVVGEGLGDGGMTVPDTVPTDLAVTIGLVSASAA